MLEDFDERGPQGMDFSPGGNIWTQSDGLKLKCLEDGFISYKHSFSLHHSVFEGLEFFNWRKFRHVKLNCTVFVNWKELCSVLSLSSRSQWYMCKMGDGSLSLSRSMYSCGWGLSSSSGLLFMKSCLHFSLTSQNLRCATSATLVALGT